jgi:hypothetical protein
MNKPNAVSELHHWLEKYWMSSLFSKCTLKIKGLYNQNSFKYNFALKVTAAQPTEFCLISLLLIHLMPFKTFLKKKKQVLNITVMIVTKSVFKRNRNTTTSLERSILSSKEATPIKEKNKKTRLKKN